MNKAITLAAVTLLTATLATAEDKELKPQTVCPVMGGKINKKIFIDVKGKRIYMCCAGCAGAIEKNPEKYIKKLEDQGITLDEIPKKEKK